MERSPGSPHPGDSLSEDSNRPVIHHSEGNPADKDKIAGDSRYETNAGISGSPCDRVVAELTAALDHYARTGNDTVLRRALGEIAPGMESKLKEVYEAYLTGRRAMV